MSTITLRVNNVDHEIDVDPKTPLLWVLRDQLGLTGTKYGCGIARCGACTTLLDGKPIRSCVVPVGSVSGRQVRTIEGLSEDGLHPVQRAWIEERVPQCGYCQAGQILQTVALLATNPNPSEREIEEGLSGNLCRCGTYPRIRRAVVRAAALLRER